MNSQLNSCDQTNIQDQISECSGILWPNRNLGIPPSENIFLWALLQIFVASSIIIVHRCTAVQNHKVVVYTE